MELFTWLFLYVTPLTSSDRCFSDGIPEGERANLVSQGSSYPVGNWVNGWDAGFAAGEVAEILLKEKLGYNVTQKVGPNTVDAFYALAGCRTPTNVTDRGCGPDMTTRVHLSTEGWTGGYATVWDDVQTAYPATAPRNLGNMGYTGTATSYISSSLQEFAYSSEGYSLDFYRDYSVAWRDPAKFFTVPNQVTSKLRPCDETILVDSVQMNNYLKQTGDHDGVTIQGNGDVHARCFDGHFWRAPVCRSNSACLLYLTGGAGWGGDELLQKATFFHMPIAWAAAKAWSDFTSIPSELNVTFFWWVPDPTFLRLAPVPIVFPPHDRKAWKRGDRRSLSKGISIDKYISKDLASLAPDIEEFMKAYLLDMEDVNSIMLKKMNSDMSYFDAACEWLHANNEIWQAWLPDKTKCFERFGLYNEKEERYVESRADPTHLACHACPPGFHSQSLEDTHICLPCSPGSYQVSGASLACDPCPLGEYQDETGSISCKRCGFGEYQNATGQSSCSPCPAGTTTLGFHSQSINDCGCKDETINVLSSSSNFECQRCGEGLRCPFGSSIESLTQGEADLGDDYVPEVLQGYVSHPEDPLKIFECRPANLCSGGTPGQCAGGLSGLPCASCEEGKAWSGTKCEECGANWVGWAVGTPVAATGLIGAYYFVNTEVMTKASAFQACLMAAGIAVNAFQSLAIFGMMTVKWTPKFESASSGLSVFVLDVEILGITCVTGPSNFLRFLGSASAFPLASLVLVACWATTQSWSKICQCRRLQRLQVRPWRLYQTAHTIGIFLQVGFSALGALALQPLMCYRHPNGQYSLLKYPDTFCGSDEHGAMLGVGIALLSVFVVGFFVYCCFGAWKVPYWSSQQQQHLVKAFLFLIGKFRLDVWWFGLFLLVRGLGFSLAIVLATESPQLQVAIASILTSIYLFVLTLTRPWKAPIINVGDIALCNALLLLINQAVHPNSPVDLQFADDFSAVIVVLIIAILSLMGALCLIALIFGRRFGIGENLLNLTRVGHVHGKVATALKECVQELMKIEENQLSEDLGKMNIYNLMALQGGHLRSLRGCPRQVLGPCNSCGAFRGFDSI
ncbi:unnamed protein product [Durusdinium trenchii]|uniref:Tyrosine-protein kinase ephrin type A/B receptor-like domain-containing protein n=1 Tax=Durusdinium trenchii TaxID=1381693 RepID=A0ABP0SBY6_9DINO